MRVLKDIAVQRVNFLRQSGKEFDSDKDTESPGMQRRRGARRLLAKNSTQVRVLKDL